MKETFVFYEDEVSRLMDHIRENYYTPSYRMVHDILQYVSAQGLDYDETLDILCALLGSLGIKKDEIEDILIQEGSIHDDNAVFRLGDYIQEYFNSPGYLMVADILQYVAAQELDEEETLDILCVLLVHDILQYVSAQGLDDDETLDFLCALLGSLGIKKDEIEDILIQEGFIHDDNAVFRLGDYIQENFNSPGYLMVADILQYVAAQELDEEETLDILCVLLDSLGIKRNEIKDVLKMSKEER